MDVDAGTGLVRPTSKWRQNQEQVSDTLSPKILKYAESGCLYLQDGEMFIWALPECILSAGNSVTVMTYKAEGSMLVSYLRKLGLSFEVSNDNHLEEDFRAKSSRVDYHRRHWSIVEAKADLLWSREGYVFIVLLFQSLKVTKEPKGEKASWCRHQHHSDYF